MADQKPTYDQLVARLEALERAKLRVDDLPLAELMRKIELLGLSTDALTDLDPTGGIRYGQVSMNFPGSAYSDTVLVNHGLGKVPAVFVATAHAPSDNIVTAVVINETGGRTSSVVTIRGRTVDGSSVGPGAITLSYFVA